MTPRQFWAAAIGIPTAVELWAVFTGRHQWTLSPHAREFLHVGTPVGDAATTILVGAGASWLAHHLRTLPPVEA